MTAAVKKIIYPVTDLTTANALYRTDDLDATFEKVRASGAEEPTEQPWGTRDCAVRGPSGKLVRIDQPLTASS